MKNKTKAMFVAAILALSALMVVGAPTAAQAASATVCNHTSVGIQVQLQGTSNPTIIGGYACRGNVHAITPPRYKCYHITGGANVYAAWNRHFILASGRTYYVDWQGNC